jgi:uncharacterized protein
MNQPAKSQEPSMEEILASIRRIIAEDDATKSQARPDEQAAPAPRPAAPPPRMSPPPRPAAPPPRAMAEPESKVSDSALFRSASGLGLGASAAVEDSEASDILDLTESMAASRAPEPAPSPSSSFRTIDGQSDVIFNDQADQRAVPARAAEVQRPGADKKADLLSSATTAAVDSAFGALANTVPPQHSRTLEDLAREMLRPMLKTWLDDNLPSLVERLVRAEIERVSRGRPV